MAKDKRGAELQARKSRAMAMIQQNRMQDATALCTSICRDEPGNADNWRISAVVHGRAGQLSTAADCYREAIRLAPSATGIAMEFASFLAQTGQPGEAETVLVRAMEQAPGNAELQLATGNLLFSAGRTAEAENLYRTALTAEPGLTAAHANLGKCLQARGQFTEAAESFRKAIQSSPRDADSYNELGMALSATGKPEEAIQTYRRALELQPDFSVAASNLLLTLNYQPGIDKQTVFREHADIANTTYQGVHRFNRHENTRDPDRRLRIGYVSADLRDHSVARFFEVLPRYHDRNHFDIFCYSDASPGDYMTERLEKLADTWRPVAGLPDSQLARLIHSDSIDILVDLGGHTARNRLAVFAAKPAPLQASYLGYPNTTGLKEMDYRLTDALSDPDQAADEFYTESLVRLPGCFLCYTPSVATRPSGQPPPDSKRPLTFGSFNNFSKISHDVLHAWAGVLAALPNSRLLVKNFALSDPHVRASLHSALEDLGIKRDRVLLKGTVRSAEKHLALYDDMDVGLDTFPYNGTTTTCEALWMGVPVVTLNGDRHAGRVGTSLLTTLGLEQLVATDVAQYIAIATRLAGDIELRRQWRTALPELMQKSPLCDGPAFARKLETAYRSMWTSWCGDSQ